MKNLTKLMLQWIIPVAVLVPTGYGLYIAFMELGWPLPVATVSVFGIEGLNIAADKIALDMWQYNHNKRQKDELVPFRLSLVSIVIYFVAVYFLIWSLHVSPAYFFFPPLSIAAALVIANNETLNRVKNEIEQEKAERKAERRAASFRQVSEESESKPSSWPELSVDERKEISQMETAQIIEKFGVTERTVRNWRSRIATNGNGNGRS